MIAGIFSPSVVDQGRVRLCEGVRWGSEFRGR